MKKFRDYEIGQTEFRRKKEEIQAQLQMYENDFEGLMDRLANMKKAYSEENEWIKTFQREELPEKLESQHVQKNGVDKNNCFRFKRCACIPDNAELEELFPRRMDGGIAMARKSRRNKNVEAVSNQIIENCENLIDTGAYIRLSVENGGNETDETLVVQQMLVEKFIEEHPDLKLAGTYIDNGF